MKFYLAEKNIGASATREQVEDLIRRLTALGWDVHYGEQENQVTDKSEEGLEEKIMADFADDFVHCLDEMTSG